MNTNITNIKKYAKYISIIAVITLILIIINTIFHGAFIYKLFETSQNSFVSIQELNMRYIQFGFYCLNTTIVVISLVFLLKLLSTIKDTTIFNPNNFKYMKKMALTFVSGSVIKISLYIIFVCTRIFSFSFLDFFDFVDPIFIICALSIYGIALVFSYGCELQQLSDETL